MSNFDSRLFRGRLFAGRLFRAPGQDDGALRSGNDDAPRRRTTYTDDELMQVAIAIVMSGALDH